MIGEPDGDWYYEMQELGFNYRITDFQSALGSSQLKKLNGFIKRRRSIASFYNGEFCSNPYFDLPPEKDGKFSSYHLYPIRLKDNLAGYKKDIFQALRTAGLGVQVHYIPVYLHPYYRKKGYPRGLCTNAERFYKSEISLPLYPRLSASDAIYVVKTTLSVMKQFT